MTDMRAFDRLKRHLTECLQSHLTGRKRAVPEAGILPWQWFVQLSHARTYHGAGPNPLSFAEIETYARLYRWPLEARHIDVLMAMDRAYLDHAYTQIAASTGMSQPTGKRPTLDAASFDVVFG